MNAQLSRILADLEGHRHLFDLDRDGLGAGLLKAATDGVQYTIAAEESPDGTPWDELSDAYREAKAFSHPGNPIAVLEGLMANPREVAGQPQIDRHEATVTYGVSDDAKREAEWFQEGDESANRPARPFWGLTKQSIEESDRILDERFAST